MSEQITFATSDFASNPEPRCPCILLLDVSGSMNGRPINELNAGLVTFRDELLADPLALKRVELGIVTFGPVHVEQPFTSAANFFPPILFAQGDTPMILWRSYRKLSLMRIILFTWDADIVIPLLWKVH